MAFKQQVRGSRNAVLYFDATSLLHLVTITFKSGEELTPGELFGTARRPDGLGEDIILTVTDATSSGGPVVIEAEIDPADFEGDGSGSVWRVEVGTSDVDSSNNGTEWILFNGLIVWRSEDDARRSTVLIQSTTVEEVGS